MYCCNIFNFFRQTGRNIREILEYCFCIWRHTISNALALQIENSQKRAIKIISENKLPVDVDGVSEVKATAADSAACSGLLCRRFNAAAQRIDVAWHASLHATILHAV